MKRRKYHVVWRKPLRPDNLSSADFQTRAFIESPRDGQDAIRQVLATVGVPIVEGAESAKEAAIELLRIAAEIEHALMVQYLYAAFSLQGGSDDGHGEDYRKKLLNVAVQEMGHLITVQNILILLGGRDGVYLQRDIRRRESEHNPIPFILDPVCKLSLAMYVAAEKPAEIPPEMMAKVAELLALVEKETHSEPNRVGALYATLIWLFLPKDSSAEWVNIAALAPELKDLHVRDEDLQPAEIVGKYEAQPIEWEASTAGDTFIIATPRSVAQVKDALQAISAQGEGLTGSNDSHFIEFMEMVTTFEAGSIKVIPLARSPYCRESGSAELGEEIEAPYTRLWADIFSLQYSLLVLSIYHALVTERGTDAAASDRQTLVEWAFRTMRRVIEPVADLVGTLPMRTADASRLAGPPYGLDPNLMPTSPDDSVWAFHQGALQTLDALYTQVERAPQFSTNAEHKAQLANLRKFDKERRKTVDARVAHPSP